MRKAAVLKIMKMSCEKWWKQLWEAFHDFENAVDEMVEA